ncbi:hypothetical protein tloyanaT_13120 [Thalassotalea loyana]|uniref:Capsid protein n=1 Tax=Thalassotalea loyana TaxID=280483 RepID=A0ABQ6HE88_9GAMM|nr:hypothetical protein [Thalassotalea loyana]GLX85060.1 hypothetical protein tloyanaT_13120 [Thalassotalea loyana]
MSGTPFKQNSVLTAIALGYSNRNFIADVVCPRAEVLTRDFRYTEFNLADSYTIPNTMVGRKGRPNEVEFGAEEKSSFVNDYGLEDAIPQHDIDAASNHPTFNPLNRATSKLTELVMLDREKRVANMIMNANSYVHKESLSGADKWTDSASKPLVQIADAIETPIVAPNVMVLSRKEALELRRNPSVVKSFNGTLGDDGLVPMEWIRQQLELDQIIIGSARYNTSNKGQPVNLGKLWTGGAALIHLKPAAQVQDDVTFCLTAEWGSKVAGSFEDESIGLRGGQRVRVGESIRELILAADAGYYLDSVI